MPYVWQCPTELVLKLKEDARSKNSTVNAHLLKILTDYCNKFKDEG